MNTDKPVIWVRTGFLLYKGKIGENPKDWRSGRLLMLSVKLIFFKYKPDLIELHSEKVLTISEFVPK
jgi:hypothetical protein